MRSVEVSVFFAFAAYANAKHHQVQTSTEKSVDELVDNLFDRALQTSSHQYADMANTVVGKPNYLAMPARSGLKAHAPPAAAITTPSLVQPLPPFRPGVVSRDRLVTRAEERDSIGRPKNYQKGGNFWDNILDTMEGGQKLRRWYDDDSMVGKKEDKKQGKVKEEFFDDGLPKTAVLVTDGDTPLAGAIAKQAARAGQQVVVVVENAKAAFREYQEFGNKVEIMRAEYSGASKLLSGIKTVITRRGGSFAEAAKARGVEHYVFISTEDANLPGSVFGVFGQESTMPDKAAENSVKKIGIPLTIVRPGKVVEDETSGGEGLVFEQGANLKGKVSLDDLAEVCVKALVYPPENVLELAVVNSAGGERNLDKLFQSVGAVKAKGGAFFR